jgi:hypothetical protein
LYEIAHLNYPDMVKANSQLQFEIKGESDDSEIEVGRDNMIKVLMGQNSGQARE